MMKTLLTLFVLLFSSSVVAAGKNISDCKKLIDNNERLACYDSLTDNNLLKKITIIPSVEKTLNERPYFVPSGQIIYGCIYSLNFDDEDLITKEKKLDSVKIGNNYQNITLQVVDFENMKFGNKELPKVGDCFAFILTEDASSYYSDVFYSGSAELYKQDFKVDNDFEPFEIDLQLTVSEFYEVAANVNYGTIIIELTGVINSISSDSNELILNIKGENEEEIEAEFRLWNIQITKQTRESILNKIPLIKIGDEITLKGHFDYFSFYTNPPKFYVLNIL